MARKRTKTLTYNDWLLKNRGTTYDQWKQKQQAQQEQQMQEASQKMTDYWHQDNFSGTGEDNNWYKYRQKQIIDANGGLSGNGLDALRQRNKEDNERLEALRQKNKEKLEKIISGNTQKWRDLSQQATYSGSPELAYAGKMITDTPVSKEQEKAYGQFAREMKYYKFLQNLAKEKKQEEATRPSSNTRVGPYASDEEIKDRYNKAYRQMIGSQIGTETDLTPEEQYNRLSDSEKSGWMRGPKGKAVSDIMSSSSAKRYINTHPYDLDAAQAELNKWKGNAEALQGTVDEMHQTAHQNVEEHFASKPYQVAGSLFDFIEDLDEANEQNILNNKTYDGKTLENALTTLKGLQDTKNERRQNVLERAENFLRDGFDTDMPDYVDDPDALHRALYDNIMLDSYDERVEKMTPEQKIELDSMLDSLMQRASSEANYVPEEYEEEYRKYLNDPAMLKAESNLRYSQDRLDEAEAELKFVQGYNDLMGQYDRPQAPNFIPENDRGGFSYKTEAEIERGIQTDDVHRIYSFINGGKEWQSWAAGNKDPRITNEYNYAGLMNDAEIAQFNDFYNKGEYESASQFLQALNDIGALSKRYSDYEKISIQETARMLPILSSVAAQGMMMTDTFASLPREIAGVLGDKSVKDPNSGWYTGARSNEIIQNEIAGMLGETGGKIYQQGMQSIRNVINGLLTKGLGFTGGMQQAGSLALFASQIYQESVYKNLKETNDFDKARGLAALDALMETAEELLPYETMLSGAGGRPVMAFIMNGLSEMGEEITGATIGEKIKGAITGRDSIQKRADEILYNGGYYQGSQWVTLDEDPQKAINEADAQAGREWLQDIKESAVGGFFGGSLGATYGAITYKADQYNTGRKIKSENNTEEGKTGAERIVEIGAGMKPNTESYKLAQKLKEMSGNGKKPSNFQLGKLAQSIYSETSEQIGTIAQDTLEREVRTQLKNNGVDPEDIKATAQAIAKHITEGERSLTKDEMAMIAGNDKAINVLKSFYTDPGTQMGLYMQQMVDTAQQQSIRQQVADLASGEGTNKVSASSKEVAAAVQDSNVATQAEIRATGGKSKGAANEIVYDRQLGTISRFENGNAVITVNGQEKSVGLHEIKAVNPTAAAVISFAQKHKGLMSDSYATKALQGIDKYNKAEAAKYLDDTMKIRLAAMSLAAQPRTSIDSKTATELYNAAKEELDEGRTDGAQPVGEPGKGSATIDGTEYGTQAFQNKLKDMGLSKTVRNQVGALSEISVRAGFRVNYINDTKNPDIYGWYDRNTGTITINLGGKNKDGVSHHLLVTAGHEMTHWLEQNSKKGYAELRQFVFDRLRANHVNIEDRLIGTIDNFNNVMREAAEKKAKADGRELTEDEISKLQTLDLRDAVAEVVANACDQVLGSRAVADELAKVNPSLYNKVKSFVKDFVARIRQAVGGMNRSTSFESRTLLNDVEQMAKIWLGARDEALGNKGTANTEAKGKTKKYALQQYTQHQIDNWKGGKIVIYEGFDSLQDFVNKALTDVPGQKLYNKKMYFGTIGPVLAEFILNKTGIETEGLNVALEANEVRKIRKNHGDPVQEAKRGQVAITAKEIDESIQIIGEPDDVRDTGDYQGHQTITFYKNINGFATELTYVVEDHNDLRIETLYKNKNNRSLAPSGYASSAQPPLTSQTTRGTAPSGRVPQSTIKVKLSTRQQNVGNRYTDEEYQAAVKRGDLKAATDMLMDKLANTEGIIPFNAPHGYAGQHKDIARMIKNGTPEVVAKAAAEMSQYVPDNAVLIPIPPHEGVVTDDTDTMILAKAMGELTGRPVVNALTSNARESRYKAKAENRRGVSAEEMGFRQIEEIPEGTMPIFIDNVVGSGETAKAAEKALGGGITLSYAKSARSQGIQGLKRATVTYDKDGNLIPLSQRFDVSKRNVNYSTKQLDEEYQKAVDRGDTVQQSKFVRQAAQEAGYTDTVYHGTETFGFTEFDMGKSQKAIFVSYDPELASTYTYNGKARRISDALEKDNEEGIYEFFAYPGIQLEIDAKGSAWNEIRFDDLQFESPQGRETFTTREIAEWARRKGYESVRINNVMDSGGRNPQVTKRTGDIGIFFYPEAVKSADPITYDDNGDIIPPSERFNEKKKDMRYSVKQQDVKQQELSEAWQKERDNVQELRAQMQKLKPEMDAWVDRIMEAQENGTMDDAMAEYKEWEKGYTKVRDDLFEAERRYKEANKAYDDYIEARDVAEEKKQIEESGLSEPEYRRKQAVDHFGYTTDFREAGYLLPNGRMLNFSGEKGRHFGSRGEDHRGIGTIYASSKYQGGEAMMQFMRDGNIRVMAETPGIDIISTKEPTKEQYAAIRNMARRFAGVEYFNVDFTDEKGYNADGIEYDGRVNPEKVVNDIKTYFRTGQAPQQSVVSQFHYSIKQNEAYMKAVDEGNMDEAQRMVDKAARQAGYTIRAYHGTGRADRVGTVFLPERATSGPMAYFTDNKEIAENYARDKKDTSIAYDEEYGDYHTQFRTKDKAGKNIPISQLWNTLPTRERLRIREAAKHIAWDDNMENIIFDPEAETGNGGYNEWTLREHKGNAIEALIDAWLDSGDLYNNEGRFLEVLKLAGIENATWNNPDYREEKVYDTYLKIQNPFNTSTMFTNEFVDGLLAWWEEQDQDKYLNESMGADLWDKNNRTVEEWAETARDNIENGRTTVWTSIPDAVSDYLRSLGHDGIQDQGGKGGGESHTVWIPFSSEQIKSAEPVTYDDKGNVIPLDERFNDENRDIRWSIAQGDMDVNRWMLGLNPEMLNTEQEKNLLKQYKGLRMDLDIQNHAIQEYTKELRKLEAKEKPSAYDREEMRKLRNRIENREQRRQKFEDEIIRVTSSEGYAGMMYRNQNLMNALINNRTADEVRKTVDAISKEIERVKAEESQLADRLNELAANEGVAVAKTYFAKAGLKKVAAKLKSDMNSKMKNSEIESRLATTALKLRKGENVIEDVMDLATLLMERQKSDFDSYVLSELRGRTFVLSDAQMAELKGQHRTLTEIRKELAGTGIKLKTGKSGTLDMVWEELCDRLPMLDRDINDLDMLDNLLNVVRSERNIARESQYGSAEQTAGLVMESVMELVDKAENIDSATKEMISFIQSMAGEAKEAAQTIQDLTAAVERMKLKTAQARGAVSVLDRDVGKAIDYFNTLTAQSEAAIWRQERAKLVAQMKSEKTEALLAEQDKWKEKIAKDKAFRESVAGNMATRKQIHTVVSRMATRLFAETDQKNIPEEAKPLVRQILQMLTDHDAVYRKITMYDRKKLTDIDQRLAKMTARDGGFDPDADLDWLVVKAKDPADNDTSLRDKVIQDLIDIEQGLLEYRNARGNRETTQHDLKEALNKIQEAVAEIYSMVRARSEAFIAGKRYELADLAEQMEGEMKSSKFKGEKVSKTGKALDAIEKGVGYGNLTPEYFFKNLKNGVMNLLHKGFHEAENKAGLEYQSAKETVKQIKQETGFDSWDGQEKHKVKVKDGKDVEMTTEQIMALYATWLRESNQMRPEETAHLLKGGFVLPNSSKGEGVLGRVKSEQRPILMTKETLNALGDYLTEGQKQWVEKIVSYMSNELAEIGNETSMQTYGIRKFTEPYYFPIRAWGGVLSKSSDAGVTNKNDNRAMRQSFTKRLTANARNAIEIGDFTPTAMKHIVGMITFNTVGPAVENMNKVLNQQLQYGDITYGEDGGIIDDDTYKRNVRAAFRDAYGEKALKYLERFMSDVNGGMTQQMDRSFKERMLSVFRKNAVAGSLSVAMQQPLSYIRAAMLINPKYLAGALSPQYWKGSYAEMLKHSGVAVIKDMGRFDMNQGQSAIDFISPEKKSAYEKISKALTIAPELADRATWTRIWSAVKMEQHALHPEMDMQSDEFLDMVGERFNEVMRKTQVYDSMMVKSQNMRSNNYAIKAMTSFMAEPTLSLNVLADAVRNIREQGGKTVMAKAGATFLLSAICQALVKGLVGSGRTPDEKKTWLENFLNKTQYALMSEANPFALVPGYSDLIELLKTGELTDDAMSVIGKFNTMRETAEKALQGKGKGIWRDIEDTAGQFLQLFTNIPAKNLMRDTRAMYNWFSGKPYADRENSVPVMKYQAEANLYSADNMMGVINTWLGDAGFKAGNTAYYQRIYDAKKAGNDQEAEDIREFLIKGRGVKPETIDSKMNSMAKYDKDLTEAQRAEMMIENGSESADDYILDQVRKNNIGRDEAMKLLKEQDPKADANDIWWKVDRAVYQEETGEKLSGNSYYYRLNDAVNSNSVEAIRKAVKDLTDHGVDKEKVKKHLSDWKQEYLNADSNKKIKIRGAIEKTYKALGYTAEDADKMIDKWKPSKKQAEKKTTGKTTTKKQSEDTTGQWGRGNINLNKRQVVHNEDGSISTESSFSVNIDGKEILLPTIINGKRVSEEEAIDHYLKTGEYLGRFNTVKEANEYAQKLHLRQQWYYGS